MAREFSSLTPAGVLSGSEIIPAVQSSSNVIIASGDLMFPEMSNSRVMGRITSGSGNAEQLTGENVRTIAGLSSSDSPVFASGQFGTYYRITPEGGEALYLYNDTLSTINKGYLVYVSPDYNDGFKLSAIGQFGTIGCVYDTAIASHTSGWVVVGKRADAYFNASGSVRGKPFRISISEDVSAADGQAQCENTFYPEYHIGFTLENRTGAGLAKVFIK
jgi:hypothetical protein